MSRTRGLEKRGRIGSVRERKERGKGREVNKVSCSLLDGALWPVVHVRRRPGTKGSQWQQLGPVHWQASWPLSTPSGQDVSCSEEESHQSRHLLQEGRPLQQIICTERYYLIFVIEMWLACPSPLFSRQPVCLGIYADHSMWTLGNDEVKAIKKFAHDVAASDSI